VAKALIADDDTLTRRFVQDTLEFGSHHVTAAHDGAEAIELLDGAGPFDVLVTDYAMPRATGVDVISHAQRVDPMLPCIVVTAFRDLDLAMRAMQAGAVAFIPKPFKTEHLLTVVDSALRRRAVAVEAMRLRVLAPMLERFTMVLASTLESKDVATQWHANRLVRLSSAVAEGMDLPGHLRTALRYGACLHDIGKVVVPDRLLRKPGPLTPRERDVLRLHPEVGSLILENVDAWDDVRLIVRHHHERFDGRGYPDGLRGEAIPLGGRIVAVVDAFDVMRTGRPYQAAKPTEAILAELERERGAQFDPDVVDTFLRVLDADQPSTADEFWRGPDLLGSVAGPNLAAWLTREVRSSRRRPAAASAGRGAHLE
jgi:cyclic di-GMP phosphodiesterase